MTRALVILLSLNALGGCTTWTQTQIDLVTQARRGVAMLRADDTRAESVASELAKLRREQLDRAFDEDARNCQSLDADWVIEARKAYAVALDAYAKAQAAGAEAAEARRRNLDAIDAALARLQWLQSVQMKVFKLPEER